MVATATVVAAVAAALGAGAAWRSARASVATSRDAMEALALGIRPRLEALAGTLPPKYFVIVRNPSDFDATDIDVEVVRRDGQVFRTTSERLAAGHGRPPGETDFLRAEAGPEPKGIMGTEEEAFERIVVRYSDGRGIARYERRYLFTYQETEGVISGGRSGSEDRIR
jgi:hypothetical protein